MMLVMDVANLDACITLIKLKYIFNSRIVVSNSYEIYVTVLWLPKNNIISTYLVYTLFAMNKWM